MKKLILVTGGDGRFSEVLKKNNKNLNLYFASKKECNILDVKSINRLIKKIKSIDLNIIGTANITKVSEKNKIKLIYFSTGYVYEGKKGNYSEKDPVKPFNNYGLSKLGGECAVSMYKNSLILRITMTAKPFAYKKAFSDLKSNFMFHEDLVKILPKVLNKKGILNIGGKSQSVYSFAKKYNKKIIKTKTNNKNTLPLNQTMNLNKLKKIIKNYN
jgi:dTDP-4-dehydrorhamnose reductase